MQPYPPLNGFHDQAVREVLSRKRVEAAVKSGVKRPQSPSEVQELAAVPRRQAVCGESGNAIEQDVAEGEIDED